MTHKRPTEETVLDVLSTQSDVTAAEIATAAKLGRSTVGKALVKLERLGKVKRRAGAREGARRLPDRWTLSTGRASLRKRASSGRLRPGELDGLVLGYMQEHAKGLPLGPT